jgi:hypothetical protein
VHARWKLEHNRAALQNAFFGDLPFLVNKIVARVARRNLLHQLHQHGMGRHLDNEIVGIGSRDLQALSDFLGDKRYFFGEQPTSLDAIAYGMLTQLIRVPCLPRRFSKGQNPIKIWSIIPSGSITPISIFQAPQSPKVQI